MTKKSVRRSLCSISLDLDDKWTYLKTHGNDTWKNYPTYLDFAVPRILDFLDRHQIKITFFIVAQDAALEHNKELLKMIADRGHDIGNHSFHHDPWLHVYSEEEVEKEFALAELHIKAATGLQPKGFRGPGFSFSDAVLKVLNKRGYTYDASTFPNILNSLARAYFFWVSNLSKEEKETRKELFGSWKDGFRPNKPYSWKINKQKLLEIPVTTMPIFKIPIHASYILFLGTYNYKLAIAYFQFAIALCKLTRTQPSILLHALDFIGSDDTQDLSFFPAMRISAAYKIKIMEKIFLLLKKNYNCITMQEHAEALSQKGKLPLLPISMAKPAISAAPVQ